MNSREIFSLALGSTDPWVITDVEILTGDNTVKELHILLVLSVEQRLKMNQVKAALSTIPRRKQGDISIFFEQTCLLRYSVLRILTSDGKVRLGTRI